MTENIPIVQSIRKIHRGEYLSGEECEHTLTMILNITNTTVRSSIWNAFFSALMTKKSDELQISGLVKAVIQYDSRFAAEKIILGNDPVYDIRGSGKEDIKTFNVSTAASIVAASCGLKIIKNGSRSTSAVSGAIDILSHTGIRAEPDSAKAGVQLNEIGFVLVDIASSFPDYASLYDGLFYYFHPLSYILPAIASPYKIAGLVYGLSDPNTYLSAKLIAGHGISNAIVVCGGSYFEEGYIDEVSVIGKTRYSWISDGGIRTGFIEPNDFGIEFGKGEDIFQGKDVEGNLRIFVSTLAGKSNQSAIDIVCINTAALLRLAGIVDSWEKGYQLALEQITKGRALRLVRELVVRSSGDTDIIDHLSGS